MLTGGASKILKDICSDKHLIIFKSKITSYFIENISNIKFNFESNRKYILLLIHPDKNQDDQLSTQKTQYINFITDKLQNKNSIPEKLIVLQQQQQQILVELKTRLKEIQLNDSEKKQLQEYFENKKRLQDKIKKYNNEIIQYKKRISHKNLDSNTKVKETFYKFEKLTKQEIDKIEEKLFNLEKEIKILQEKQTEQEKLQQEINELPKNEVEFIERVKILEDEILYSNIDHTINSKINNLLKIINDNTSKLSPDNNIYIQSLRNTLTKLRDTYSSYT